MFDREDVAELLERRLRRSVTPPTFVGLDCCIGGDVDDGGVLGEMRERQLRQPERSEEVGLVDSRSDARS
jgi:hypothetical protein